MSDFRCASCGEFRPATALLVVTERGGLHRARHVCRPSRPAPGTKEGECFSRAVRSWPIEAIALAKADVAS